MIIYIENKIKHYKQVKNIINKFPNASILHIDSHKNILDKTIHPNPTEKKIILANLEWSAVLKTPDKYWPNKHSFFIKTSLNCFFSCDYCYLQGLFKNNYPILFLNYEDIKQQVSKKIEQINSSETKWFFSWDYSDTQWFDFISDFNKEFIPFFEDFKNTMLEIRTKSADISSLLDLWFIPQNTEIAYSINTPQVIERYEKWTASLEKRIENINYLVDKWFKVWLRFLPLLPTNNAEEEYINLIKHIKDNINIDKLNTINIWWLMFTKKEYNKMLKKQPNLDILYKLEEKDKYFVRIDKNFRKNLYEIFYYHLWKHIKNKNFVCMDYF